MSDVKYWKDKLNSIMIEGRGVARGGGNVTKRTAIGSEPTSQSVTSSTTQPSNNLSPDLSPELPQSNVPASSGEAKKIILPDSPPRKLRADDEIYKRQQLVDPDLRLKGANVWRDARNPRYAGLGQTQPVSDPVSQSAPAPSSRTTPVTTSGVSAKPVIKVLPGETMDQAMARIKASAPTLVTPAGSTQPQPFTRMGDIQKQLDVSAGRGLNTSAQVDPLSMPREPQTGYGRPAPATQGSNIKNMLSRLSRLGRSAGDDNTNLYVSPMRSGVASRGTTPVQDRAYITDLQNKLAKNPLDDNLRGELARMQRFYPDEIKETSMSSAQKKSTGPKFPGYMRGTDPASSARSKMVGSVEESVQHRATVLMNRYKNFKAGK